MKINDILNEESKGLWANIHAKQNRIKSGSGEKMRKPGSKGAPTAKNFKDAQGVSEEVDTGQYDARKKTPSDNKGDWDKNFRERLRQLAKELDQERKGVVSEQSSNESPVVRALTSRILIQRSDLLKQYGPEKIMQAIDDVADFVGDVDEIGSSDVSGWVRQVERYLSDNFGSINEEGEPKQVNMKRWWRDFERREDNNFHTENVIAIAKLVGSPEDIALANDIKKQHMKENGLSSDNYERRTALYRRLWPLVVEKLKEANLLSEGAPELLKAEMPLVRHIEKELADAGWNKDDEGYDKVFSSSIAMYRKFGNVDAIKKGVAEGSLNEFAPSGGDEGDDGFSEETLKMLAAQWYNGDEDPRVERTLMAAGWEIGQDEGYDDEPGVFVVQRGDVNGNSYMSWPAHELNQGVAEGILEESYDGDEFYEAYGDLWYDEEQLNEAEYQGRKVQLGKPMQGDVKKFKVYVKDPSTGNVKKVNFGDPNMKIRKSNPGARKSFRARHNCDNPGPRTKARYWSCRKW